MRPRVGVSECLLGRQVRYDGGHKRNDFLCDALGVEVSWVPVCPEVEVGMPVPRESMRLVGEVARPRLITQHGIDHTEAMETWAERRIDALAAMRLDGYVLKKGSPSCGLERVRVYAEGGGGGAPAAGSGVFAAALRRRLPSLPLTEEGWLFDERRRESFLDRVFTHARLREAFAVEGAGVGALVEQHAAHKLLLMAHSPSRAKALGRLVGVAAERPFAEVAEEYVAGAMEALAVNATRGKHANVLQHMVGYFRGATPADERDEILARIDEYRRGLHPLAVPLTLIVHHLKRHDPSEWLAAQVYLAPYPLAISPR